MRDVQSAIIVSQAPCPVCVAVAIQSLAIRGDLAIVSALPPLRRSFGRPRSPEEEPGAKPSLPLRSASKE